MQRFTWLRIVGLDLLVLLLINCPEMKLATDKMIPFAVGSTALMSYYTDNQRLPESDVELLDYCKAHDIALDLSGFSTFDYSIVGDSNLQLDFVIDDESRSSGSVNIRLE